MKINIPLARLLNSTSQIEARMADINTEVQDLHEEFGVEPELIKRRLNQLIANKEDLENSFQSWLAVFCEEKEIDLSRYIPNNPHNLQVGDVLSAMNSTTKEEQKNIKATFVKIDFLNGDVYHYIDHLSQALSGKHKLGM